MSRIERIKHILEENLNPRLLEVVDESHHHRGHGGWVEGEVTHVKLIVESDAFKDLSRVKRQQLVNKLLDKEFKTGLHALTMRLIRRED